MNIYQERAQEKKYWNGLCLICVTLMVLLAVVGGAALEWRKELAYTRQALDRANERIVQLEWQTITPKVAWRAK